MKRLSHQPKAMVIAIAIALGSAVAVAGCAGGYDDNANTSAAADTDANMAAGTADSNQPVNDTWITTKVKSKLATMDGVDNTALGVETNNGVVTLTGAAASQASVDAIAAAAMGIKGVTRVDTSGLTVGAMHDNMQGDADNDGNMAGTGDSQQPVQDTWITTKVLAALQTVDGLDNTDIDVETNDGVVTLSGRADSQALVDAAVKEAKTIQGVKDVDTSRLTIGPDTDQ